MKIDTITYCFPHRTAMFQIHGSLDLCVDPTLFGRGVSQRSGHSLVLKARQQFPPKLYEQKGLILHSRNSRGRVNISPASRHRTAHSRRLRYWSNLTMFPSHASPAELVITTTFGTSHGPTQPLIVS